MPVTELNELRELATVWAQRPWLTIDTEFIREDTYYPRLCLVQIGDGTDAWCIDTLAISDLSPLFETLEQTQIVKVLHAASQDFEIFFHERGRTPQPLFDSQIAATLLGLGDQLGYAALVEQRLGIRIDKTLSRTNWARRPLNPAELAYAAADVQHLAQIYPALRQELIARGRLDWLEEDCRRLSEGERFRPKPALEWRRLKGLARLSVPGQHRAAELAAWRETIAVERNRPRKWILADELLYSLAERQPRDSAQLLALGVPQKTVDRYGQALIERLAAPIPDDSTPLARDDRLDPQHKALMQRLQQAVREVATDSELPPTMLAPRADIEALMWQADQADIPLLRGWRRELLGERLLALLP